MVAIANVVATRKGIDRFDQILQFIYSVPVFAYHGYSCHQTFTGQNISYVICCHFILEDLYHIATVAIAT